MTEINGYPREIRLIEESRRMLAEARTIDEVKMIRDQAEALRMYVKQQNAGLEIQNAAAEIKIRAERRAGQLLSERIPKSAGRPSEEIPNTMLGISPPSLSDLGISYMESSRWQRIATLAEPEFEAHLEKTKAAGKELTTVSVLRLAHEPRPKAEKPAWTLDDAIEELGHRAYEILHRWPPDYIPVMIHQLRSLADELERHGDLRP